MATLATYFGLGQQSHSIATVFVLGVKSPRHIYSEQLGVSKCYYRSRSNINHPQRRSQMLLYPELISRILLKFAVESGSSSEWRPVVTRKNGFFNYPTTRLHIPTVVHDDAAQYATDICQKEATNGTIQKLVFQKFDAAELESLIKPGTVVDGFLSLDLYDYQQSAEGLSHIASAVGKPLYADSLTESMKRISFARVCIEIDAFCDLVDSFDRFMGDIIWIQNLVKMWKSWLNTNGNRKFVHNASLLDTLL
ncbi:hypothetical protein LWI29_003970 [Acer saccharum]|uniref:Uncharacterized protein n=1 Tax=Acer saccharum TaxID=4024 RepID=A0AA39VQ21_ACESA|nr:hypothetical protein LWI29_003970 [Acer saccharum]